MSRPYVVLINSNQMRPPVAPLALDYIGERLAAAGVEVSLLDLSFADELDREPMLTGRAPTLVGISFRNSDDCYLFSQAWFVPQLKELIEKTRAATSAPLVLGGCGFSIFPRPVLDYCGSDLGIVGDGEETLAQLTRCLARGEDYRGLAGLAWRDGAGRITINPPRYERRLSLPTARGIIDNARYLRQGGMGNIETKRGCPMPCIYCADPLAKGDAVRCREPAEVADEVEALRRQGVDMLHVCDGEFNIPPEHALAVCAEISRRGLGERLRWYCYASVQPFSDELAAAMRRAGCVGINFGADSGCDRMLAALGRGYSSTDIRRAVEACRRAGLTVMLDLLIGGPGEDERSARESIAFIKEVNPDRAGAATGLRIYPGTPLAAWLKRQGPLASNPHLHGCTEDNDDFFRPVFYLDRRMGDDPAGLVVDLIAGDERFFPPPRPQDAANYNYNDNRVLEEAIAAGARGAFWDILRRLHG